MKKRGTITKQKSSVGLWVDGEEIYKRKFSPTAPESIGNAIEHCKNAAKRVGIDDVLVEVEGMAILDAGFATSTINGYVVLENGNLEPVAITRLPDGSYSVDSGHYGVFPNGEKRCLKGWAFQTAHVVVSPETGQEFLVPARRFA